MVYIQSAVGMTLYLRFVVVALTVQICSPILFASDASGWVEEDCSGATFHIRENTHASAGQELVFRLRLDGIQLGAYWGVLGEQGLDVQGKRCSGIDSCEEGVQAKIWLHQMKRRLKKVSGKYAVDFDGQHLEGQFVVKYRKHNPPVECE
jgi:hypothetical protein